MEKQKTPERQKIVEYNLFKNTAVELQRLKSGGSCDLNVIQACIESLDLLISKGPMLQQMGLHVMEYIDAALHRVYPGAGSIDAPETIGLLEEERDILRKIRGGKKVEDNEIDQVSTFCQEMWYKLSLAEKGVTVISRRKPDDGTA